MNDETLKLDILAFPQHAGTGNGEDWRHGMTLRDAFAKAAMQARLSDYESCKSIVEECQRTGISFAKNVAAQSYDMADAMLAERVK